MEQSQYESSGLDPQAITAGLITSAQKSAAYSGKLTLEQRREIVSAYKARSMPVTELAAKYGVSRVTIYETVRKDGRPIDKRGRRLSAADRKRIMALLDSGMQKTKIAALVGVSMGTVQHYAHKREQELLRAERLAASMRRPVQDFGITYAEPEPKPTLMQKLKRWLLG